MLALYALYLAYNKIFLVFNERNTYLQCINLSLMFTVIWMCCLQVKIINYM